MNRLIPPTGHPDFWTPPPFRVCDKCGGAGFFRDGPDIDNWYGCKYCHGLGYIPVWYTIPQWEAETGRKVPDDIVVWYDATENWTLGMLGESFLAPERLVNHHNCVIATEAGRPPKDWRRE